MGVRDWILGGMASQLGKPAGVRGLLVGRMLNRSNRGFMTEAIDALSLQPGAVAADLGFGGGVGLGLLLERVGPNGQVHGVDFSATMVNQASRRYRADLASGRLHLNYGSITELPLQDGSIDGAITINTIYFIADLDRAFAELARVIAPTGRVVVGIGDPSMMARIPTTPFGFTIRQPDAIEVGAKSAGLVLQDHKRVGEGDDAAHLLVFGHGSQRLPLEIRQGDLFAAPDLPAFAHGCNCAGSMGAGIAVEFRRRWPAMYEAYRLECREGRFKPGGVFVWEEDGKAIFNLATQPYPGPSARLEYIQGAVEEAVRAAQAKSIPVIGMPRIGAGYGGLDWGAVRAVLESVAQESDVLLAVYELPARGAEVT